MDALIADIDTIWTGDQPSVPHRPLPLAERAGRIVVRAPFQALNDRRRLRVSHAQTL